MKLMGQDVNTKPAMPPLPAGTHIARLVNIVDFGTQKDTFQGQSKLLRKVRLVWEVPGEVDSEGRPRLIGRTYTASMYEKAKLREDFGIWRGKMYSESEAKAFRIESALGQACGLGVIHNESQDGKISAVVKSINPVAKGTPVPEQVTPSIFFDLDNFSRELFESLPEWMQKVIASSPEYAQASKPVAMTSFGDDDVPF